MFKHLLLYFFAVSTQAARIVEIRDNLIHLETQQIGGTDLFDDLKVAIKECRDGQWKNWQTASHEGRDCLTFEDATWVRNLETGCEFVKILAIQVSSQLHCTPGEMKLNTENAFQLTPAMEKQTVFQLKITSEDAIRFSRILTFLGSQAETTGTWATIRYKDIVCDGPIESVGPQTKCEFEIQ